MRLIKDKRNEQRIIGRKDTLTINRSHLSHQVFLMIGLENRLKPTMEDQ